MAKIYDSTMFKSILFILLLFNGCVLGYESWTEYWEAYEAMPYFPRLYPYKEEFHQAKYADGDGFDAEIQFQIPYFGRYCRSAYVAKEGFVKLSHEVPPIRTPHYPNTELPNPNYPNDEDPPLIAPYYSAWELRSADPGNIFWGMLDPEREIEGSGQKEIVLGLLEVLSQEVRRHVVGGDRFHADKGLIVTWDEMEFYGCVANPVCPTNTVQMALVTEEFGTYVIYNYYNVTWVGGTGDFCDPVTGLPGDTSPFDKCFPAQAGFNEGEGRHFLELPHSNTQEVADLDVKGATGVQGRYIYDVTHPTIVRGGCTNDTEAESSTWKLEVYPKSVSLFGGTAVYFSGPCLLPSHDIRCRFGSVVVTGKVLTDTHSKGMCVSPRMDKAGWTDFCVSTDGGNQYSHCTRIHIVPKYYHWSKIHIHNDNAEWYSRDGGQLSLQWDPYELVFFHESICGGQDMVMCNETEPSDILVDISLIGYKEQINANGTLQGSWIDLHIFSAGGSNTGEYSFSTAEHECKVDCGWEKPQIGMIKISVSLDEQDYKRSIYSEPVPLGWYLNSAFNSLPGENWPELMCIDWATAQRSEEWKQEAVPCPMTKSQAYTDIGRFIYPNLDCDPGQPCPMRPRPEPHIECVDSVVSTSAKYGSSSTCCYTEDGSLLYGQDSTLGSTLTRASPYASRDSYDVKVMPWLSHWSRDRQPYILCCHWSSDEICHEHYMTHRKPPTDQVYEPVEYGTGYGDPHFTTFDGNEYMFNGHGEFWLLKIEDLEGYENFMIQIRVQQPPNQYGHPVNASLINAIVMQEGWSLSQDVSRIQIEANDMDATSKLSFYVNGALKEFDTPDLMYQEIYSSNGRRTIIQNNDPLHSNHQSNFTMVFHNGVTVQAANRDGFLQLVVVLPQKYFDLTNGILGTWNNDPSDDLRTPNGEVIPADDPPESVHTNFGMKWEVQIDDTLFIYRASADWGYFRKPDFVPNFKEPEGPSHNITDEEVNAVCGENFICRFDYKTTMSKHVANTSLYLQMWTNEARRSTEKVLSCSYMEIAHSHRTVDKYTLGGQLTITSCDDGYTLLGQTDYECAQVNDHEAKWQPSPDAECKSDEEIAKEQQLLTTAIVVPIVLIVLLAAVAGGGFVYYRKRKQPKDVASESPKKPIKPTDRNQQFEELALSASRSQSLASVNNSFGSIVLMEELQTARPPRPQSMHRGPPLHPVAGHAQLSHGPLPYGQNTSMGSYDQLMAGQGYSLSPNGPANQSRDVNNPQYGSPQNGQVNRSFDSQNGQMNRSFDHQNRQANQSFDRQNGQVNQSFDRQNGQVNRSFDHQNGQVNRSFDRQNGAISSRAASQTSLSRIPQGGAAAGPAVGMPNPALAAEDSDYSEDDQAVGGSLNNSRSGQQAVYTMNGFGENTVV